MRLAAAVWLAAGAVVSPRFALADTIDPQRVEERLPEKKPPADDPAGATKPSPINVDQDDLASIPEFVLRSTRIEGVTAIERGPADECAAALAGKTIGAADLMQLTDCITGLYRVRGYFLSRAIVPKQEVQDGILNVEVVEGYIAAVVPDGIGENDARSQFAATLAGRPAHLDTFERDLLLLADRHGHRIASSQLVPDPQDMARYTLKVKVTIAPVAWRVHADNRGNGSNGSDQVFGSVSLNSLAAGGDRIAATLFTSPSSADELIYVDIAYALPWFSGALWTEAGASISQTRNVGDLPGDTTDGESERLFARATAPLIRSRAQSLWATLSLDVRKSSQSDSAGAMLSDEKLRTVRGSLSYTLVDGATRGAISIELVRGLDVFDASLNGDSQLTRPDGRPQFAKVRVDAALTHELSEHLSASFSVAGQHADGAMVGGEEFGAGGARFGRAYDYSEISGDDGAAIAIELRHSVAGIADWLKSFQVYAFADAAMIWNGASDTTALSEADLSSTGLGMRLTSVAGVTASFELAQPLSRDVAENSDRGVRAFVTLQLGW